MQRLSYQLQYAETYYSLGFWMTAGGLAVMVVPAFFKQSDASALVITAGFLSYQIGIQLLAFNTGDLKAIAKKYDTAYKAPMSGWPFYLTGKGMQILGLGVIAVCGLFIAGEIVVLVGTPESGPSDSEWKTLTAVINFGGSIIGIGACIELFS